MTYQEILEGITRHRADSLSFVAPPDMARVSQKVEEIEWALQALAEKLAAGDKI